MEIDTTYADLLSAMTPAGVYPPELVAIAGDAIMDAVSLEQAKAMLESIEQFDRRFGAGTYSGLTQAMSLAVEKSMMALPPEELIEIGKRIMKLRR